MHLTRVSITTWLMIAWVAGAHAGSNSGVRARAFAALPAWPGIWQSTAWLADASGRPPGGEAQIKADSLLLRPPPYNALWAAKYQAALDDTAALAATNKALKVCERSFPAIMEGPRMFQVAILPEETLLLFENGQVRHVYTDGRAHPSNDDLWPTPLGNSIGHWEKDTLVVETTARTASEAIAPRSWAAMLSENAFFIERIRMTNEDTITDDLEIHDPDAFKEPWSLRLRFKRLRNMTRLLAYDCYENDRNPLLEGKTGISPPSP